MLQHFGQDRITACEDFQLGKRLTEFGRVFEIIGGVFQPCDLSGKAVGEGANEVVAQRDAAHLWEMIEEYLSFGWHGMVNHFGVILIETLVVQRLEVKGRQGQNSISTPIKSRAGQADSIFEIATACANHHLHLRLFLFSIAKQIMDKTQSLRSGKGTGFSRRPENNGTMASDLLQMFQHHLSSCDVRYPCSSSSFSFC